MFEALVNTMALTIPVMAFISSGQGTICNNRALHIYLVVQISD